MKITIQFDTDNDAFKDRKLEEIKRILNNITTKITDFEHSHGTIFDANGNTIGWFKVKPVIS